MSFPVWIRVGPLSLHPHWVFEVLAYSVAGYIYVRNRRGHADSVDAKRRWKIIVAAVIGGLLGGRLLYVGEDPVQLANRGFAADYLLQGKTIVGALIGGLIAVEWVKRRLRVEVATGDLFVAPLIAGIAVGRVGCFLTGLPDRTYGISTRLPWGVDFGDGVPRHPTQLYEIVFLAVVAVLLYLTRNRPFAIGDRFKIFMIGYVAYRLLVDFIKPAVRIGGLSTIQWASLAVIAYYGPHVPRLLSELRQQFSATTQPEYENISS